LLEGFDIDPQRSIGAQGELLVTKEQVATRSGGAAGSRDRGFEGAADGVEDLVQVVGGVVHPRPGPKRLHNLLAVEAVPRGQSEQLHEAPGLPQAPPIPFDDPRTNPQAKAAEQPDAHHLRLAPGSPDSRAAAVLPLLLVVVLLRGCQPLGATSHPPSPCVSARRRLRYWLSAPFAPKVFV
jgi:hypothetical protein